MFVLLHIVCDKPFDHLIVGTFLKSALYSHGREDTVVTPWTVFSEITSANHVKNVCLSLVGESLWILPSSVQLILVL